MTTSHLVAVHSQDKIKFSRDGDAGREARFPQAILAPSSGCVMPDAALTPELADHLALALVPGLGPKLTAALLEHFGDAAAIRRATEAELEAVPLIGAKLAQRFASSFTKVDVAAEWALIQRHGVELLRLGEPGYPPELASISDPPPLLYLRGKLTPADRHAVSIVGSRTCSSYGLRIAERLASGLARAGWTVISGLARGIDGAAHRAALAAGGRTIAVLAGGLSSIYPPEHADLAEQVAACGALITETPMTMAPQAGMFPARNRIISGMSRAVVVVEANVRSGALITVSHAAEQGREVFAVPGPVDSPASAGCLELIRKGARLVRTADDILEDLRGLSPLAEPIPVSVPPLLHSKKAAATARTSEPAATLFDTPAGRSATAGDSTGPTSGLDLDGPLKAVWDALVQPRHADELARDTGLPASELAMILMKLEMKRQIRRLPGNQYERRFP